MKIKRLLLFWEFPKSQLIIPGQTSWTLISQFIRRKTRCYFNKMYINIYFNAKVITDWMNVGRCDKCCNSFYKREMLFFGYTKEEREVRRYPMLCFLFCVMPNFLTLTSTPCSWPGVSAQWLCSEPVNLYSSSCMVVCPPTFCTPQGLSMTSKWLILRC